MPQVEIVRADTRRGRRDLAGESLHRWQVISAVVITAAGLGLRARVLASPVGRLNADEAVVGLMADNMRATHHFPLFYWGQYYGGTIEPVIVALAFMVYRSALTLKVVALGLSFVGAGFGVVIGRKLFGDSRAWIAGAVVAASPGTVLIATREYAFYWAQFVLVLAVLFVVVRVISGTGSWRRRDASLLGLLGGLAWWQSPQSAFVLVPLAVWILWAMRPPPGCIRAGVLGMVLGAAPWFLALYEYGAIRLATEPRHNASILRRLELAFSQLLPRAFGLRGGYRGGWLAYGSGRWTFVAAISGFVVLAWRLLRNRRSTHRGFANSVPPGSDAAPGRANDPSLEMLVWCAGCFPVIVAIPAATGVVNDPRYALLLVPIVALLVARLATSRISTTVVVVGCVVFGAANVANVLHSASQDPHGLELRPLAAGDLARDLYDRGVRDAYGDYWIAAPITFASNSRVRVSSVDVVRGIAQQAAVDDSRSRVWLLYRGATRDRALPSELARLRVGATRSVLDTLAVYRLDRYVDPTRLTSFWKHHHAGAR